MPSPRSAGAASPSTSLEVQGNREHRSALVVAVANIGYTMRSMAGWAAETSTKATARDVIEAASRSPPLGLLGAAPVAGSLDPRRG